MVRLALLGYWHVHAKDYANDAAAHPATEIIVSWDDDEERGREWADRLGIPFEPSLDAILSDPNVEGVIITTATAAHPEIVRAVTRARKPIFMEKLLALTTAEADEILREIERADVPVTIALRWLPTGGVATIKKEIASGRIGEVASTRIHLGHDGAVRTEQHPDGWLPARFFDPVEAGGGILTDLGAHPLYLTRLFLDHLGMPATVSATYGYATGRAVEDNAVVTFGYANGTLGVIEVTALSRGPIEIEVFGTTGALRWDGPGTQVHYRTGTRDGEWEPIPTAEDAPLPFFSWANHLAYGEPLPDTLTLSRDLTVLAEAANTSAREGRPVRLTG